MIFKNQYGFFEIENKPSEQELEEYYAKKYYQLNKGNYENNYSEQELKCFRNKLEEKLFVTTQQIGIKDKGSFIDIGAGEGYAMSFFKEKGWNIVGLDYSAFGCQSHNPHCNEALIVGDIYKSIENLINQNKKFDLIHLGNVLEHVVNPMFLLERCKELANGKSCLIIEVPNDFSVLQNYLLDNKMIENQFWIAYPDHLSYFSKEGLNNLCVDVGWTNVLTIADYPIDLHFLNKNTNYAKDKLKGKSCHLSQVLTDNLFHSISVSKTVAYYKALADLWLGRQIIGFFTLTS
jgi:2-polyprenyl-3-methyl-5-hydroxy-6-metoxy-1,4-benzoquinol methylase